MLRSYSLRLPTHCTAWCTLHRQSFCHRVCTPTKKEEVVRSSRKKKRKEEINIIENKFRDGTRKRERETRVRRVNKTHATGGVPPSPSRDSQGMHGAERRERRCCPKYLGLPTLLGFFFFSFKGKKEKDTTYRISLTPLSLIKRNNSSSNS